MTESGTCVPPGPSKNASGWRNAEKRSRTASTVVMTLTAPTLPACVAGGPSDRGPRLSAMRLRPLSEAECYARCYGAHRSDQVSVIRPPTPRPALAGEQLRRLFESRLDARG